MVALWCEVVLTKLFGGVEFGQYAEKIVYGRWLGKLLSQSVTQLLSLGGNLLSVRYGTSIKSVLTDFVSVEGDQKCLTHDAVDVAQVDYAIATIGVVRYSAKLSRIAS